MPDLMVKIPRSISNALVDRAAKSGASIETIVNLALSEHLNTPLHTLFQVSTSGALVAGVYDKQVSVQTILEHGDFGLGTFAHLDGEMVVLDGHAYQVRGTGAVAEASPDAWAPFAVVTRFSPEINVTLGPVFSFLELQRLCDSHRKSGNLFYALRVDGALRASERARSIRRRRERACSMRRRLRASSVSRISRGRSLGFGRPGFQARSAWRGTTCTSYRAIATTVATCWIWRPSGCSYNWRL
jgi:acetolactate decarboxylase